MSNTISNQVPVSQVARTQQPAGPARSNPSRASASSAVAQTVTSAGREGLTPLPEGWKPPVAGMAQTPQERQDYCDYQRMSPEECRRDWNRSVDDATYWNAQGTSSAVVPTDNKPTLRTQAVGLGMAALIRSNEALRRVGVVK